MPSARGPSAEVESSIAEEAVSPPRMVGLVSRLAPPLVYLTLMVWGSTYILDRYAGLPWVIMGGLMLLPLPALWWRPSAVSLAFTGCLLVEQLAALLTYHAVGEIDCMLKLLLMLAANGPLALMLLARSSRIRKTALWTAVAVMLLVAPYSLWLGFKWWAVHTEAERVVAWAEAERRATGRLPADLQGYEFRREWVASHIDYGDEQGELKLYYHVATESTSHWYNGDGTWGYYPD